MGSLIPMAPMVVTTPAVTLNMPDQPWGKAGWAHERSRLAAVTVSGGDLTLVVRSRGELTDPEQVQARKRRDVLRRLMGLRGVE